MLRPLPPSPARATGAARFFGAFAFAVLAEAALARRFDMIDGATLMVTLIAVASFATMGMLLSVMAFRDVWRHGAPGFGAALGAFLLATVTVVPFLGAAAGMVLFPPIDEVSTDLAARPIYRDRAARPALPIETLAPVQDYDDLQREAYPDIQPRSVPLSTVEAHAVAHMAAAELGWRVTEEAEPANEDDAGWIEAEARSLVFGLPYDVAIRVTPDGDGSRIDIRSGSRLRAHDLGENARRVRAFFGKLDEIMKRPAGG